LSRANFSSRAGLQNYAGLAGVEAALEYLRRVGIDNIHQHERALAQRVAKALDGTPGMSLIGAPIATRAGIVPLRSIRSTHSRSSSCWRTNTA
jgi:cysteine desulfurase/selenocysteine lyase